MKVKQQINLYKTPQWDSITSLRGYSEYVRELIKKDLVAKELLGAKAENGGEEKEDVVEVEDATRCYSRS